MVHLRHLFFSVTVLLLLSCRSLYGQNIDSLLRIIPTQNDTDKAYTYGTLAQLTLRSDPQKSNGYATRSVELARKTNYKWGEAFALRLLGILADETGDYQTAITRMNEALVINRALKDRDGISACLASLGVIYQNQSKFEDALRIYYEILPFYEAPQLAYNKGIVLSSIAGILKTQNDLTGAKQYALESFRTMKKIASQRGEAITANNLGMIYYALNQKDSTYYYLNYALEIKRKQNDKKSIAASLSNLSSVYDKYQEFEKAIAALTECITIQEEISDNRGLALSALTAGDLLSKSDKPEKAIDYYLRAYKTAAAIGDLQVEQIAAYKCGNDYYNNGKYKEASDYIYVYSKIKDSLFTSDKNKSITEMRTRYDTDKKEQALKLLNQENKLRMLELAKAISDQQNKEQQLLLLGKEKDLQQLQLQKAEIDSKAQLRENEILTKDKEIQAARLKQAKTEEDRLKIQNREKAQQLTAVLAGSVLLLILLGLAINGYRQKRKANTKLGAQNEQILFQKAEIGKQKDVLETKNKEITDSINYAKRLQEAILPPEKFWKSNLPESFIFYQPKDIVAGDFYWMEKKDDLLLFAAADCTGHGVPGALVSVVCSNALNRTVKEFGISDPAKILEKVRELVIETFARSENEVNDGMDISLCTFNPETRLLQWAGANNPLWIIRNSSKTVEEITANKQPIGAYSYSRPFDLHEVQLEKNDCLYLFSDGYADQFGGPKGKKFKYKSLQELLLKHHQQRFTDQLHTVSTAFFSWKGELEQIDDVLVIGIRIL